MDHYLFYHMPKRPKQNVITENRTKHSFAKNGNNVIYGLETTQQKNIISIDA